MEYAIDVSQACRERGVRTVAVTAGEICAEPREEFFRHLDAANVDLKAFTEEFYQKVCGGRLEPVKETLKYVRHETETWLEITTLLIPGMNDSDGELDRMTQWISAELGPDVPLHFTAFHPDFRMLDTPPTPVQTLKRARDIALGNGLRYCYTGNVHDKEGGSTYCATCSRLLVGRDRYVLSEWGLNALGACSSCGTPLPGVFEAEPGNWGARRVPVRLSEFADRSA